MMKRLLQMPARDLLVILALPCVMLLIVAIATVAASMLP